MTYIKGNFRKYIFKSDKGYVVGLFKVRDTSLEYKDLNNKTLTFTGYFGDLNETDLYIFYGEMNTHQRYGEQFSVSKYEITLPNEKDNIVEFLSSNLFPGIGLKKATLIVDVLGNECLDKIIKDNSCLFNISGLTEKQKNTIIDNLTRYEESYKIITELTRYGFNMKDALTIYSNYKSKTIEVISNNPYLLIDEIYDVTYNKIEQVRKNFNILDTDERRVEACIKHIINTICFNLGNTYCDLNEIIFYTEKALLLYNEPLIMQCINNMLLKGEIVVEDNKHFLKKMYEAEKFIAKRIFFLSNESSLDLITDNNFKDLEDYYHIFYNADQEKAIKYAIKNKFLVITGGPGTGKTTIIKAITKLYQDSHNYSIDELINNMALLAPTGRAAKRISEQTLLPASTIHRFLKWNKEDDSFGVNENNQSNIKFLIIDEASMIDTYLLYNLLLGVKDNTKIILIGDYDQLPSVGPGQVLKDIIDSECVDVIRLTKLYRQDENSNINLFAHNINNNIIDFEIFNESDDLTFIESTSNDLKSFLKDYVITYKDFSFNKFQVLAPIYKGQNGIDDLNFFMQDILNPKSNNSNEIIVNGTTFRENDKVLQLVNMVDENVFNGDIGKVLKTNDTKYKEVIVNFDTNIVKFTPTNFLNIRLGYTISIHKSQGSEFDVVIIPILNKYASMLYKKLIYTGVTRAKKRLIIIGEKEALTKAILNNKEMQRETNLKNMIISCIKK